MGFEIFSVIIGFLQIFTHFSICYIGLTGISFQGTMKLQNLKEFPNLLFNGKVLSFWNTAWKQKVETIRINDELYPFNVSSPLIPQDYKSYKKARIDYFLAPVYRERWTFVHMENVFVGYYNVIDTEGNYYDFFSFKEPPKDKLFCKYGFRHVVFCPFRYGSFGHWLHDQLASLVLIPKWVWDTNPVIVVMSQRSLVLNSLFAVGLGGCFQQIIQSYPHSKEVYYGENIYFIKTYEIYFGFSAPTYKIIRDRFLTYYKTKDITPTEYRYINKEQRRQRYISNMNELIKVLIKTTKKDWKLIENNYKNVSLVAYTFGTTKLLITGGGSITFNMFYMHPNTCMLILMGDIIDYPNICIAFLLGIFSIAQPNKHIPHNGGTGGDINITTAVNNVKLLEYVLIHHRFPNSTPGYVKILDMEKIKNIVQHNQSTLMNLYEL